MPPNPQSNPADLGERFMALAYRTTRAMLICRHLLPLGRTLQEVAADRQHERCPPVDPTSVLRDVAALLDRIPCIPHSGLTQEEIVSLATAHGYTALKLGIDPMDPCLHWFEAEHFRDFFPDIDTLVEFEAKLLTRIGKAMLAGGRVRAAKRMEHIFGPASTYERKDWAALPMAFVRDFASVSTDDDRTLMVTRLESIAARARSALDLRTELAAQRAISSVQGLTFQDGDKQQRELFLLLGQQPDRNADLARLPAPSEDS